MILEVDDDDELSLYRAGGTGEPSPEAVAEWTHDDVARVLLGALRLAAIDATRGDENAARWVAEIGPALVRRWVQPSLAAELERFAWLTPAERGELLPQLERKMVVPAQTRRRKVAAAASWPPPDPQGWRG